MDPTAADDPGCPGPQGPEAGREAHAAAAGAPSPRAGRRSAVATLLSRARERSALERMLVAWATHPAGAGFTRVQLLVWSPSRRLLSGQLWWAAAGCDLELGASLLQARRASDEGPAPERTHALRALTVRPEHLEGVAAAAWRGGSCAVGPEARAGELRLGPAAAFGAVPVGLPGRPLGLMLGEWDRPGELAAREAALAVLRDLAGAAWGVLAAREAGERRARHARALAELARACVSPLNLAEVVELAGRLAVQATGARGGALWLVEAGAPPVLQATHGPPGSRERLGRALAPLAADVIERGRPLSLDRVTDEPRLVPEIAAQMQSLALVPFAAFGRPAGALAIYDRLTSHPSESEAFEHADLEFLTTLADLVAMAEDQARRCAALRLAEQRQHELQREVTRSERLAALGEMAVRVAHEVRNPLASIGAFARRVQDTLAAGDPGREYLEIVVREAERLERMVGEQLQYARLQRPRLRLEGLNGVLQEVLQTCSERMVRRRVRLLKKLTPDLPPLLLDAERIRRVLGNILDHALESVAPGGRLRVESRRSGSYVVVDVAHDGERHPGDLLEHLFVPFAVSRQGGPGVGLAVALQILKQHGGEMRVRSEGEWNAIFSFTLPIPENQDRRLNLQDRRRARADRRERFPAS